MATRVHVRLDDAQLLEQEPHLEHGGMLLPIAESPPPMTDVEVQIETGSGRALIDARVVHVVEGAVGLALHDASRAKERLQPLFARARGEAGPRPENLRLRITRMSSLEKQELALTGDRPARMALLKDSNKGLHTLLLKNRKITSDEIRLLAGYRNANPDALAKIAAHREWVRDTRIVAALVSNPKTPPQVAMRLLDRLSTHELRRLARGSDVPPAIARAARRKLS